MPAPKRHKRPTEAQLQRTCDLWNQRNPVGTTVSYESIRGEGETFRGKSSSEAQVLSGHSAVVWLHGKSGCVDLDHCTAVATPATPVLRINLVDGGQDFADWYVRDGIVIDCQPNQGRFWVGTKVTNAAELVAGSAINVTSLTGEETTLNYPVAVIETLSPEAAAEVEEFGRGWAKIIGIEPTALGL